MDLPTPDFSADFAARLRAAFTRNGYDVNGVREALGTAAHQALVRGEPEPAAQACADAGELGTLIRLFLLGEAQSEQALHAALAPVGVPDAVAAGLLLRGNGELWAALDVRPHGEDEHSWWVVADLSADHLGGRVPRDHVVGVGQASLSLIRATSRRQVDSLLDLGTGNGVQVLHAQRHARNVTATDVTPRALAIARATFLLNDLDVTLLDGEWFTPVAHRRFDQIVCNPPFVVGPATTDYVYRDSGLAGDDASSLVIRQLPGFLNHGGVGQLLASWLHIEGEEWDDRVSRWLPGGTDAWFVQRDVADPVLYVGTWLHDAGIDPASELGRAKTREWLEFFRAHRVAGIGFGFVTLRRTDAAPTVVCEDLRHGFDDPLGPESARWLDTVAWLREHDGNLLGQRYVVPESVRQERLESLTTDGWHTTQRVLHRSTGAGWSHELDEHVSTLLAGCQGALTMSDVIGLLAAARDTPADDIAHEAVPLVRQLVLHGMLEPAEWQDVR